MANIKFSSLATGSIATGVRLIGMLGDNSMRLFTAADLKGNAGPAGPAGAASTVAGPAGANGLSAYQVWLAAGNSGTQAQFLDSIRGAKGETGAKGEQGIQGIQGPPGSGSGSGGASNASGLVVTSLGGRPINQELKNRTRVSIWDFDPAAVGNNANNKVSSRYGTLAAAQAAYPTVPNITLDDQLDWAALQALVTWSNTYGRPVTLSGAKININRPVTSKGYLNIDGENASIGMQLQAKGRIDNGSTPALDMSYPSVTNPGPMDGCCFYVADPAYYMVFQNINFYDGRFGICYLNDPNSPIHRNLTFNYMNCGVFYYLGCQNARYYNCGGAPLGVLHISSATAHVAGSGREGNDNFYSDNCTFANEYGFNSFGIYQYDAFDIWFRDSIFRPTAVSTVAGSSSTYNDANNNPYPITDRVCLPTGRLIYMPFRNIRICFSLIIKGQDSRGSGMKRGYAYIGTEVKVLTLEGNQYEQLFEGLPADSTTPALMLVGAITSGTISEQAQISYIDLKHPFVEYTGRGQNEGFRDDRGLFNLGAGGNLVKDRVGIRGFRNGRTYEGNVTYPLVLNQYRDQSRTDANAPLDAYFRVDGKIHSNFETETLMESIPTVLYLPTKATDGKIRVQTMLRTYDPYDGFIEVAVRNLTTGETDAARYYISIGNSESRTLANPVKNGDTVVTFTAQPDDAYRSRRYAKWSPNSDGTGKGFSTNRYIGNNQIEVINGVSGLTADIPAGTVMYRNRAIYPVQEFQRGWVRITGNGAPDGGIDFQGDDVIALRNVMGDFGNPGATDSLEITIRASQLASTSDRRYLAAAPTTGFHLEGEEVYRIRGSSQPVRRWRCKASGSGTGLFIAADFDTLSGATAARPTLTVNDGGVLFYDTTLSKLIRWSGTAWQV